MPAQVLVADVPMIQTLVACILERYGYAVQPVSYQDAPSIIASRPGSLLITNDPARILPRCQQTGLKLLYMASCPDTRELGAERIGACAILRKPFHVEDLVRNVRQLLELEAAAGAAPESPEN